MMKTNASIEDRFVGCLLGLAVGDALGAYFEGQSHDHLASRFSSVEQLMQRRPLGEMWYTDDTQMAIGVAETMIACQRIDEVELCRRFAANYVSQRGYGRGARRVLQAMVDGKAHRLMAQQVFPGGSYGNGAAMRVAPVGLLFRHDHDELWRQAQLSALPTHVHPLGIEGAQLIALAVAIASATTVLDRCEFFDVLAARCTAAEYAGPLRRAVQVSDPRNLALFGNGIEAPSSVVTAIAAFGLTPDSYEQTIGNAILLGGDTDTIAAMAGAISGAYLGWQAIPPQLLESLEDRHQGRTYIQDLARQLYVLHQSLSK